MNVKNLAKKDLWCLILQALIAVLTALLGVLTGCQLGGHGLIG